MYSRSAVPESALALARQQAGVITREQLTAMGSSRRCVVRWTQEWSRVARGVYYVGPLLGDIPYEGSTRPSH
ncbi:MAG: type IV toxin-antitoxin system AbiEi family antitoxin domain-containing protein [Kineosporiaceae bacterium]